MDNERLYLALKNRICENIYRGLYKDKESIPPERLLAESLDVSRVTVRKALELLEKDGIVKKVQGSGNIVNLRETGYEGAMDIIALLAPAQKTFFSLFIDHFQKNAENHDSLVLFKQKPKNETIEDSLFKLFQKNIRNAVVWLEDVEINMEYLRRLRGLGMNIVFFDIVIPSKYADCVSADNQHAIKTLYEYLAEKKLDCIAYVGWDNYTLSSIREREYTFSELRKRDDSLYTIPWDDRINLPGIMKELAENFKRGGSMPGGMICGDGELGIALKEAFLSVGINKVEIISVDDLPEANNLFISVYRQSYEKMARKVYQCLLEQNRLAKGWQASVYKVEGEFIERKQQ